MHQFDKTYWENHWAPAGEREALPVNPYLPAELTQLPPGTALDAGCGTGTEAIWLAEQGWQVTGADISATALAAAAARAAAPGTAEQLQWVETDLTTWEPDRRWDLVVTSYAHPETGQLAFYRRISSWVAPGGTLLIVGHLHQPAHGHPRSHPHPETATATLEDITELFAGPAWHIEAGYENTRTVQVAGRSVPLRDAILRARRLRPQPAP
ncbi:class I SAM-dependent methyltransferase [Nesterenkonia alkaliphila]|uniref:Methyltransferase domain-containing protein n=1 Tax=Nesterenkonia alkaliphila TaxID=1463631 RepID=A0A7K1UKN3_9MICC|nr:class I SAM-dependent methyltransferase [Nesterenkonia alkaliphila]MVT26882.1 methyltransferase domain-containing protein [Nesterenkonia alkaliphila]GFZ82224.1 hypothetical protein GCM10011359_08580 [Nesterenkonia alkaliphila]